MRRVDGGRDEGNEGKYARWFVAGVHGEVVTLLDSREG